MVQFCLSLLIAFVWSYQNVGMLGFASWK